MQGSPILFILALDQLVHQVDNSDTGVSVGEIKSLRVLVYVDDAAMMDHDVETMTQHITEFADDRHESETVEDVLKNSTSARSRGHD